MKLTNLLSVAFFAFIGGNLRYLIGQALGLVGTLSVNIGGCFLLAFLTYYLFDRRHVPSWLTTGLGTGLIGAFTTFSTFSLELGKLLLAHAWGAASAYFVFSSVGGLTLVWLGYLLAQRLRGLNRWC